MDSHFKPQEFIGARTLNAAKRTRLWALSSALDHVLYSMHDQRGLIIDGKVVDNGKSSVYSVVDRALYMGVSGHEWDDFNFPFITPSGSTDATLRNYRSADVPHLLRYIQAELERLALLEVTS